MPKPKPEDILEWTIHDDLQPDEPLPELPSTPEPARKAPARWQWVLLAIIALLVALTPWLYAQWEQRNTRDAIERSVAAAAVEPPLPLRVVQRTSAPAEVLELSQVASDTVRADIAYGYLAYDGQPVTFTLPRFFRRVTDDQWQMISPPDTFPGEARLYTSERLSISYFAADADLIEDTLAPYLEAMLQRACAEWDCTPDHQVTLDFVNAPRELRRAAALDELQSSDPLLLALIAGGDLALAEPRLSAPHQVGQPTGAAGLDLWKRVIATRALAQLARQLARLGPSSPPEDSPFFYALLARASGRLAIDTASRVESVRRSAAEHFQQLWWYGGASSAADSAQRVRDALALLNGLLRDQPPKIESEWFHQIRAQPEMLNSPSGTFVWLTAELRARGLPAAEYLNRLQVALTGSTIQPAPLPGADFILMCQAGPQLVVEGALRPVPALDGLAAMPMPAPFAAWSPDGRRVAVSFALQTLVLDLESGDTVWPPDATPGRLSIPAYWQSNNLLAYTTISLSVLAGDSPALDQFELAFFDVDDPAREIQSQPGVFAYPAIYALSPDRTRAARVQTSAFFESEARGPLLLQPALGGAETEIAALGAFAPTWAPDGRRLAFLQVDRAQDTVVLRVTDIDAGTTRAVWNGSAWTITVNDSSVIGQAAWSPDGNWIALSAARTVNGSATHSFFGVLDPSGGSIVLFSDGAEQAQSLGFSSDGRYLAAILRRDGSRSRLAIFDRQLGWSRVRELEGEWWYFVWSPHAARLLLIGERTYQLDDPARADSQPVLVTNEACGMAVWNPK